MASKYLLLWTSTAIAVVLGTPVYAQPLPLNPPVIAAPVNDQDINRLNEKERIFSGLVEPVELGPQYAQELNQELPPPAPVPDGEQPAEESSETPSQSKTDQFISNGVERFGAFTPIGSVTMPANTPNPIMPKIYAVDSQQRPDVHYLSPPVVRPWENTVLRPHNQFCHQPLYFEEVNLERYGIRRPVVQPFCSAAHFFGSVAMLPYKMSLDRPMRCYRYPHPYLPGVNGFESRRSLRLVPAVVQASIVTGMFLVAP